MKNRKIMWVSILLISLVSVGFLGWRFYSGSGLNASEKEGVTSQEVESHSDESTVSKEEVETFPEEEVAVVDYKPFGKEDVLGIWVSEEQYRNRSREVFDHFMAVYSDRVMIDSYNGPNDFYIHEWHISHDSAVLQTEMNPIDNPTLNTNGRFTPMKSNLHFTKIEEDKVLFKNHDDMEETYVRIDEEALSKNYAIGDYVYEDEEIVFEEYCQLYYEFLVLMGERKLDNVSTAEALNTFYGSYEYTNSYFDLMLIEEESYLGFYEEPMGTFPGAEGMYDVNVPTVNSRRGHQEDFIGPVFEDNIYTIQTSYDGENLTERQYFRISEDVIYAADYDTGEFVHRYERVEE